MLRLLGALLLVACHGGAGAASRAQPAAPPSPGASAAGAPADRAPARPAAQPEPLFPRRAHGWKSIDAETRTRIADFAAGYAEYLAAARTPRQAVAGLVARFRDRAGAAGDRATELLPGTPLAPGSRAWFTTPGGGAAVFAVPGQVPIERGMRILIALADAPRIELKNLPIQAKAGLVTVDTVVHGRLHLASWLSRPMALHIHLARPGAKSGDLDVSVGDDPGDPVLVIPDLLPHLSRKAQKKSIVDSPERMDAIAARTRRALTRFFAAQGMDERDLAQAEATLVPAAQPELIGVDRALLAGYGHSHRAMAYAAVRALAGAESPRRTAVVIVIGRGDAAARSAQFVQSALSRVIAAIGGRDLDVLDTRRIHARSAALLTADLTGDAADPFKRLSRGLLLAPLRDDATPRATRRVLDILASAGAQYQLSGESGRGLARELSTLDMDVVEIALPTWGRGAPAELISTLDLYQARLAAGAWLTR